MILVSVGTSEYPFDRLLKIIDELCKEKILEPDKIIAQIGESKYKTKTYKCFKAIGRDEYQQYINDAEYIITHAGTGSVVPPLTLKKKIILFPRIKKYGEHIDDHQLELCEIFKKNEYVLCAKNKKELIECIEKVKKFEPKTFKSNKIEFNKMLIDYIENN